MNPMMMMQMMGQMNPNMMQMMQNTMVRTYTYTYIYIHYIYIHLHNITFKGNGAPNPMMAMMQNMMGGNKQPNMPQMSSPAPVAPGTSRCKLINYDSSLYDSSIIFSFE